MLGHFPTPYLGELLYSLCARYTNRVGYTNPRSVLYELFGTTTITAVIDLPNHLGSFAKRLPAGTSLTVDNLIDLHTLLSFFSPFLPPSRIRQLRKDMSSSGGSSIHMRSGLMASRVSLPAHLRYCPICKEEDEKQNGESYWHRLHQLAGVLVCPAHQVFLQESHVSRCAGRKSLRFITAEAATQALPARHVDLSDYNHHIMLKIARDAAWLLEHPIPGTNLNELHGRYLHLLLKRGLATYTGSVQTNELLDEFKGYYSPPFLRALGCEFTGSDQAKNNWLLRLVRPPKHSQHPLYHLLLIQFLGYTAEEFFRLPHAPNIFGEGPWPCLNAAAKHYRKLVIREYRLSSRSRGNRPVVIFNCECGFTYARSGPDSSVEDKFRVGRIILFGSIWEAELKRLWKDSSNSLSEIGRRLCVDPLTARRHATRLQLSSVRSGKTLKPLHHSMELKGEKSSAAWQEKRRECRLKWLNVVRTSPRTTLKELRHKLSRDYAWLLQNDYDWLKSHSPQTQSHLITASGIDWKARDFQYAVAVKASIYRLRNAPGRPVRVTRTAIGRDLGAVTLLRQKLHRMPLTTQVIADATETWEEYAIRRVQWAANLYLQENLVPQRWQLELRANVYRYKDAKGVRDAVYSAIHMLKSELSLLKMATA